MRSSGTVAAPRGLGYHDHLCWAFDDQRTLTREIRTFLADGLALGQRAALVGTRPAGELREWLAPLPGLDELMAAGTVEVHDVSGVYAGPPAEQAAVYAAATDRALADGYTGLRVAADATDLVATPHDREAFVRYEHEIDRLMAGGLPFAALCAYDIRRLGEEAYGEVACVHPLTNRAVETFRLHAAADGQMSLAGEVDALPGASFPRALDRVLDAAQGPVTLDCSELAFIDHHSVLVLDRAAGRAGVRVELRGVRPVIAWMTTVLPLDHVGVAAA